MAEITMACCKNGHPIKSGATPDPGAIAIRIVVLLLDAELQFDDQVIAVTAAWWEYQATLTGQFISRVA